MAQPVKQKVLWYPHNCKRGRVVTILEGRWGNDGYAFFYKLLELLGDSEGHSIDCSQTDNWEYLIIKTKVSDETAEAILQKLADLKVIDPELWKFRVIWSDDFIASVKDAYRRRICDVPTRPVVGGKVTSITPITDDILPSGTPPKGGCCRQDDDIYPQRRVEESREEKDILSGDATTTPPSREKIPYDEIVDYLNKAAGTSFMSSTKQTRSLISARWSEGFRLPEFKTVIDSKVKEWGKDPKMRGYLRPQTLFGTKFEGYFQNSPMKPKQAGGGDDLRPRQGENLADYYHRLKEAGRLDVYFEVVNGGEG